jgi:hypothetical protein
MTYSISLLETNADLRHNLNINVAASFGFGTGGVDSAFNYYRSSRSSRFSNHLMVRVVKELPTEVINEPELTKSANDILNDFGPASFFR